MSTRGFLGFVADGQQKIAYNHSDSYPDGLGIDVLKWLREADLKAAGEAAVALRAVGKHSEPTDDDIAALKRFYNPHVGGHSERPTWYQLLRGTQGDPAGMLDAGVIEDASGFPADSLFAEYGYVVDFDSQRFEAYVGYQTKAHTEGRFASPTPNDGGFYPARLVASWPLDALPTDDAFYAAFPADE